jgi:hypothetical protein
VIGLNKIRRENIGFIFCYSMAKSYRAEDCSFIHSEGHSATMVLQAFITSKAYLSQMFMPLEHRPPMPRRFIPKLSLSGNHPAGNFGSAESMSSARRGRGVLGKRQF